MPSTTANIATLLARTAMRWPRLPAVASGTVVLHDYATLAQRAQAMAAGMRHAGLREGDRVALVARNCPGYIETLFACWIAGLVARARQQQAASQRARLRARRQRRALGLCRRRVGGVDAAESPRSSA